MSVANKTRLSICVFFFLSGFSFSTWASRIPALQHQLNLNDAQLGSLLFALPAGLMVTMPLVAYLLSKISSRYVMLAGATSYAVLLLLLGFATKTWQVVLILFLFGASRNVFNISVNTQALGVQALFSKSIIAAFHGIWSVAAFLGAGFASLLVSKGVATAQHFVLVSCITLVLIVLAFSNTIKNDVIHNSQKPFFSFPKKTVLKYGILAFCSMVCEGTMSDWGGIYFTKEIHIPQTQTTVGYVAYLCAMACGRFIGDKLVNILGVHRVLILSGLAIAAGMGIAVCCPLLSTGIAGFVLVGLGVSCVIPLVFKITAQKTQMATGVAIASVATVGYFGFLVGPPLVGFMAHVMGLKYAFGSVGLLGLCITYIVSKQKIT